MKKHFLISIVIALPTFFLGAMVNTAMANAKTELQGSVYRDQFISSSPVFIYDSQGKQKRVQTDETGHYQIEVSDLLAPLFIVTYENEPIQNQITTNCAKSGALIANCMLNMVYRLEENQVNTAHVNPFTDFISSEIAS